MKKGDVVNLYGLAETKTKIIQVAHLLLSDNVYSREEAAGELLLLAYEMSEEETEILGKLHDEIKNEDRLRGTLAGEREDDQ